MNILDIISKYESSHWSDPLHIYPEISISSAKYEDMIRSNTLVNSQGASNYFEIGEIGVNCTEDMDKFCDKYDKYDSFIWREFSFIIVYNNFNIQKNGDSNIRCLGYISVSKIFRNEKIDCILC